MSMAEVRHARSHDWESLKAIRLRALRDSPDAFCTTFAEAVSCEDEVWVERSSTDPAKDDSASFLAFDREDVVGLAVGVLCDGSRLDVFSVFVDPTQRGTGVAQDLMEAIERWGSERGARDAVLDVEASNRRAGSFYEHLGYVPTGRRETYPGRVWLHRLELTKSLGDG
jgi:ribosomal protein S18 acetylase RimI-like enzyme